MSIQGLRNRQALTSKLIDKAADASRFTGQSYTPVRKAGVSRLVAVNIECDQLINHAVDNTTKS